MEVTVKVSKAGKLVCYQGKEKLHRAWEEIPMAPGASRAGLRPQLDSTLLHATLLIFGNKFKPADYNEVHQRRALVKQIMADSPKALIPIFAFVVDGMLSATPANTIVRRFKNMLQRIGAQDFKLTPNGGCYCGLDSKGRKRKDNDENHFWQSYRDFEKPGLSEAGWRYLQKLTPETKRNLSALVYRWSDSHLSAFNLLGQYGLPSLKTKALEVIDWGSSHCSDEDSKQYWARAVASRFTRPEDPVTAFEIDCIRDWFYEEKRKINAGTRWETISVQAFTAASVKIDKTQKEMAGYQWRPPIEPFVADEGIVVVPLSTGTELLQEGMEMDNCLRNRDSYAKRAVAGKSQVFSVRGAHGRASVEFARHSSAAPWYFAQAEGPDAAEVTNPTMLRVIEKIKVNLQGAV